MSIIDNIKEIIENASLERLIDIEGKDGGCLAFMGIGMLGVFMIVSIIMGATYLTSYLTNKFSKNTDSE